ncbi:MAG TPA: phage tail sheath subtilisin-like domain-containing protein [Polyangia bacterium]|nr:phage tail sheath subtilisin-like domain-containing protein [Polyangia bacterium]
MKAWRDVRPPGVYPATTERQGGPIGVADTRIAGFVGLASRGPLDVPRRIGSWNEFLEIYGTLNEGYLSRSVEGFFLNGGKTCYVLRVAHRPRPGEATGIEHAALAERVIKDGLERPTLRVSALNEGRWGNAIWVRFAQTQSAKTLLTLDLDVGAGEARVSSSRGFERGSLVRIFDRENSDYVILTEVEDRTLRWGSGTPVLRRYRAAGPTYLELLEFEVHVSLKERREAFRGLQLSPLSRRYVGRVVNEQSQLIQIEDLRSTSPLPQNLPQSAPAAKLAGGRDGFDEITAEDFVGHDHGPGDRAGLMALGAVEEVATLCVPDAMLFQTRHPGPQADRDVQRIHDAMIDLCELRKDLFAILDAPLTKDLEVLRRVRRRMDTSFAALYYPWLTVGPTGTQASLVPPSGHIAGIFARCDTEYGAFKAPANEVVQGAKSLSVLLHDDHLGELNAEGINTMRSFPGRGIRVWGARTVSDQPEWRYVNVRRLFIMLRRSITEGTEWAVFEPNQPRTWEWVRSYVGDFLREQWRKGAFAGASVEEAFYVKCNGETNPPEVRDQGMMVVEIGVAPAQPAEFIVFTVTQEMGATEPPKETEG